jgi:hypothetical protein
VRGHRQPVDRRAAEPVDEHHGGAVAAVVGEMDGPVEVDES